MDLRALAITPAARAWLARPARARVLNVFERACNLVDERGEVLAVVISERGLTPFALMVESTEAAPFRGLRQGNAIQVGAGRLRLGPVTIDTTQAALWDPSPNWMEIRSYFEAPEALAAVWQQTIGHGPAGSLLELFGPETRSGGLPAAVRRRAEAGALLLGYGLQAGELPTAVTGASRLAGLGGGLTPAGDDFILGALLGAWAGLYSPDAAALADGIAAAAAPLTTTLSAAYLRAAARGECSAYWHDLFAALARREPAGVQPALSALLAVGHTSGADALAGFLAAHWRVCMVRGRPLPAPQNR